MRVVCVSDTHLCHDEVIVPEGDLLIHAGDLTGRGTEREIAAGMAWLDRQPHARVVFVPGNHDFGFERRPELARELALAYPHVEVAIDRAIDVGGVRLYGSPFQPWFHDWAFNFPPGAEGARVAEATWRQIPLETAILVTHGPVHGILDLTARGEHAGCAALRDRIAGLRALRLHVAGHIHEAYGTERHGDVLYVNAAICDLSYHATHAPVVVDLDGAGGDLVARIG